MTTDQKPQFLGCTENPAGFSYVTKKLLLLASLLLLSTACYAVDLNTMTPAELQEYVQGLQQQASQPAQPTIITIQADQQLNDKLDILTSEMANMKDELQKMQERFNRLATDTSEAIDQGNKKVVADTSSATQAQISAMAKEQKEYIDQKTNPVRQNAPAIGVFMILTGAFLLWAGKQYKLTQGARNNGGQEKRD